MFRLACMEFVNGTRGKLSSLFPQVLGSSTSTSILDQRSPESVGARTLTSSCSSCGSSSGSKRVTDLVVVPMHQQYKKIDPAYPLYRNKIPFHLLPVVDGYTEGETRLIRRIRDHNSDIEWQLINGVNPKACDRNGDPALHLALRNGRSESELEMLMEAGADPYVKNRGGFSAFDLAKSSVGEDRLLELYATARLISDLKMGYEEDVSEWLELGADPNMRGLEDVNATHCAMIHCISPNLVLLLLEHGAKLFHDDGDGDLDPFDLIPESYRAYRALIHSVYASHSIFQSLRAKQYDGLERLIEYTDLNNTDSKGHCIGHLILHPSVPDDLRLACFKQGTNPCRVGPGGMDGFQKVLDPQRRYHIDAIP